jgi:hypothetical protein
VAGFSFMEGKARIMTIPETTIAQSGVDDQAVPLSKDTLGFQPYVDAVFNFLYSDNTQPPFTMSIEGEWGTGKSSFMLQLRERLLEKKEISIDFNAWRHDNPQTMWSSFALEFVNKLARTKPWYERVWCFVRLYFKNFEVMKALPVLLLRLVLLSCFIYLLWFLLKSENLSMIVNLLTKKDVEGTDVQSLIHAAGWWGFAIFAAFLLKKLADVLGNPIAIDLSKFNSAPNYAASSSFIETFHEDMRETVQIMTGKKKKVFVFIDDLDRAEVPKAAELMQGLNMMMSSSSKLIFIIGMDREKVAAGIAAKYKDLIPYLNPTAESSSTQGNILRALDFGFNFLEKFIQLAFRIPSPSPESIRVFLDSLNGTRPVSTSLADEKVAPVRIVKAGDDSEEFKATVRLISPFLDNNPRRIKQFVNAFRLKAHICYQTGLLQKITIPQLGKFVAIITQWPDIVVDLVRYPKLLAQLAALGGTLPPNDSPIVEEWYSQPRLLELIDAEPEGDDEDDDYSLRKVDVGQLLETSPVVSFDANAKLQPLTADTGSLRVNFGPVSGSTTAPNPFNEELRRKVASLAAKRPTKKKK